MDLRKTLFFVVAAVMLISISAASQSMDIYSIGGFEGTSPFVLEYRESADELDVDVGDGPIPITRTLAEDHENGNE